MEPHSRARDGVALDSSSFLPFKDSAHHYELKTSPSVPIKVEHLEQLLKTCAAALLHARSGTSSPEQLSRAATSVDDILLGPQARDKVDGKPTTGLNSSEKHTFELNHYDGNTTERADWDDEAAWQESKIKWAPLLDKIPDIWSARFPDCAHAQNRQDPSHAGCHPLTDPQLRLEFQRELVLARLNLEQEADKISDPRLFFPWLSLISYKLHQVHLLSRAFSQLFFTRHMMPHHVTKQTNILVQMLRYFYEGPWHYYVMKGDKFSIGSLLSFCYRRGCLLRPESSSDPRLESNFRHAVHALWVLNIIQTPRYSFSYNSDHVEQRIPIIGSYVLEMLPLEAISKSVSEIEHAMQQRQPELPYSTEENVRCSDLNLKALKRIGGLQIVWTSCERDHLFLDQANGVLRLSFFDRVLVPEFYKYMSVLGSNDVTRTWMLMLGYRKNEEDTSELEDISLPPELASYEAYMRRKNPSTRRRFLRSTSTILKTSMLDPKSFSDIREKLLVELAPLPKSVPFDYFGKYEQRVRILRHYMDNRKPTGLRNLYHDRRDSLSFYTFWAVIVFGGLSMLLAFCGVALGVAQTIAAFRQLEDHS